MPHFEAANAGPARSDSRASTGIGTRTFAGNVNWIHTWNSYDQAVDGYTDGQADMLAVRGQLDF